MRTTLRSTVLALTLLAGIPAAQAATQTWNFSGTLDSGHYSGQSFGGSFSFDDAALTGFADEWLTVGSLSLNFLGNSYTQADAAVGSTPEVSFYDGVFLGLSYSAGTSGDGFTFTPGYSSPAEAFVAYDTPAGFSGAGSLSYAQPVPEPETYAMLLAGLGLLGMLGRRRKSVRVA
jgi:hypothetical protein